MDKSINFSTFLKFVDAPKPEIMTPISILVVEQLLRACGTKPRVSISMRRLAERCNASVGAIQDAISLLGSPKHGGLGYVTVTSGKTRKSCSTYTVDLASLPRPSSTDKNISNEAHNLAQFFFDLLGAQPKQSSKKNPKWMVKFHRTQKDWKSHWAYIAQKWLNEGYDEEHIKIQLCIALEQEPIRNQARMGMQALNKPHILRKLREEADRRLQNEDSVLVLEEAEARISVSEAVAKLSDISKKTAAKVRI